MVTYDALPTAQRASVCMRAVEFFNKHKLHVKALMKGAGSYDPQGVDLFQPEIWKGAHWKWFNQVWPLPKD